MYRELKEEIGLGADDVEVIGKTRDWLRYHLPKRYQRSRSEPLCIGQKQVWYLLKLTGETDAISFSNGTTPEFDRWCWVDFWYPLRKVIFFKRAVYESALEELSMHLFDGDPPPRKDARRRSRVQRLAV
jgi:putative (di)nucleoside polyphosphate hydrolase